MKDKAAAAAQAILEPGIATDGGQQMSRQQFGTFIRRFAAASGLTFSAITDFLLVVPVFDYDPAFMDPGMLALSHYDWYALRFTLPLVCLDCHTMTEMP